MLRLVLVQMLMLMLVQILMLMLMQMLMLMLTGWRVRRMRRGEGRLLQPRKEGKGLRGKTTC